MTIKITKPQTLSGRYFSKKELVHVQQTVADYPCLSLTELAATLCENLHWTTAQGRNKINACISALDKMQKQGLVTLPVRVGRIKRQPKPIIWTPQSEPADILDCELSALGDIRLERVTEKADIDLWKAFIDRYHYLGYHHPIGASLKYFAVTDTPKRQILACLLFSAATWHIMDRDQWIGWTKQDREKRLNLVTNNKRFLILPWVKVPNLASHVLSLALRQLREDWYQAHAYRPVLVETFVDDSRYKGSCYHAANWQCIGKTSGKDWKNKASSNNTDGTIKSILIYPLQSNYKAILNNEPVHHKKAVIDEDFLKLWGKVSSIISEVSLTYDAIWQKRKRVIDSLLLVFLIFRLVFSKNSQSYGTTITEFWHNCHRMKFPLPQKKPIAASAFTEARKKLDETIFKDLNARIIQACPEKNSDLWFGHRLFAVDGSKINLPRELLKAGYKKPQEKKHYPQGLLSCCYQLKSKIPYDFDLVNHGNERSCADQHLKRLKPNDVNVYDRGYYSYASLNQHHHTGVYAVYRLKRRAGKQIDDFISSGEKEKIITLMPNNERQKIIKQDYPDMVFIPLKMRLIKYEINGHSYYLGTTLFGSHYTIDALKEVYHARWGVEELYKVSKQWIEVDDFHGRSERTVKQELFAHFVLITMSRLCADASENLLHSLLNINTDIDKPDKPEQVIQVNFKNTLTTVSRHLEEILFAPAHHIQKIIADVVHSISRYYYKTRPGRHYERKSMRPMKKWSSGWLNTP